MKIKRILFLLTILHLLVPGTANGQTDSIALLKSQAFISIIDYRVDALRDTIAYDDFVARKKLQESFVKYTIDECNALRSYVEILKGKLYADYGDIENIKFQIEPTINSYLKCINSLQVLTSHTLYQAYDRDDYNSAYLFKELAKGNLFRVVIEKKVKENFFAVKTLFGYNTNGMYNELTDAYKNSDWVNETGVKSDFESENANSNLFYGIALNCIISKKIIAGIEFETLPSFQVRSRHTFDDSLQLFDRMSETMNGNAVSVSMNYVIKNEKESGYGFRLTVGGSLALNNYTLKRKIETYSRIPVIISFEISETVYTTSFDYFVPQSIQTETSHHSLAFAIKPSLEYFFNRNVAACLTLSQSIDTGANIEELTLNDRALPSYKLSLSSFSIALGAGVYF